MDNPYGIDPQKFYSDSDLGKLGQEHGFAWSRTQLPRLRKRGLLPPAANITPGLNSTLGQDIIDMIEARRAEAQAA